MAVDLKYGRVDVERGDIGTDEPVVVFRAQDKLLPAVLECYRTLCEVAGSPPRRLDAIERAIVRVRTWQQHHDTQVPQSAGFAPAQHPATAGDVDGRDPLNQATAATGSATSPGLPGASRRGVTSAVRMRS